MNEPIRLNLGRRAEEPRNRRGQRSRFKTATRAIIYGTGLLTVLGFGFKHCDHFVSGYFDTEKVKPKLAKHSLKENKFEYKGPLQDALMLDSLIKYYSDMQYRQRIFEQRGIFYKQLSSDFLDCINKGIVVADSSVLKDYLAGSVDPLIKFHLEDSKSNIDQSTEKAYFDNLFKDEYSQSVIPKFREHKSKIERILYFERNFEGLNKTHPIISNYWFYKNVVFPSAYDLFNTNDARILQSYIATEQEAIEKIDDKKRKEILEPFKEMLTHTKKKIDGLYFVRSVEDLMNKENYESALKEMRKDKSDNCWDYDAYVRISQMYYQIPQNKKLKKELKRTKKHLEEVRQSYTGQYDKKGIIGKAIDWINPFN